MDILQNIRNHADIPLSHQYVMSLLTGFKRPNDKIHDLIKKGILTPVKKGIYIPGPVLGVNTPEPYLIANHLLGPSYVSAESALHHYGLMPEKVYETVSMTTKAARVYTTPVGRFSYIKLRMPYYALGINQQKLEDELIALMASPEKALFDKIVITPQVLFRSKKESLAYLVEDLRLDEGGLKNLNTGTMREWLAVSPKKETLFNVIQSIALL